MSTNDELLAVIEQAREEATSLFGSAGESFPTDDAGLRARKLGAALHAILATSPADALAELKRVTAEKAWDEGFEACDDVASRGLWPLQENPYRANPEPTDSTNGATS